MWNGKQNFEIRDKGTHANKMLWLLISNKDHIAIRLTDSIKNNTNNQWLKTLVIFQMREKESLDYYPASEKSYKTLYMYRWHKSVLTKQMRGGPYGPGFLSTFPFHWEPALIGLMICLAIPVNPQIWVCIS